MSLPMDIESSKPATSASASTTSASNATTLPPAAIELAGKLFDLARTGSTAALAQYIDAGIPPNLTNNKGDTLLMLASYHGHASTASMLLSRGADPDALNDRGQSVVAGAVFKDYEHVVRLLWEAKADIWRGQPCAVDAAKMFRHGKYLDMFGVEDDGVAPWDRDSDERVV